MPRRRSDSVPDDLSGHDLKTFRADDETTRRARLAVAARMDRDGPAGLSAMEAHQMLDMLGLIPGEGSDADRSDESAVERSATGGRARRRPGTRVGNIHGARTSTP